MNYETILNFWKERNITNEAELSAVLDSYAVNFSYNSGKIENDNITYHDTREIFDKNGVTSYTGDLKTLFEIQNAKNAYEFILKAFDQKMSITEEFLKEVQKILTIGTYDQRRYQIGERPGEYKRRDYVVGKNETGALAEDVPEEINELLDELMDIEEADIMTAAAYFHAKFENIHPFSDGNGRTGRLLMNYFLLLHNHPPITIFEEDRKEYYKSLEAFDNEIKLKPLVDFLHTQLEKTWCNVINKNLSVNKKKSPSLNEIIDKANYSKKEIPISESANIPKIK